MAMRAAIITNGKFGDSGLKTLEQRRYTVFVMGLAFVLLFWAVGLTIAAAIAATILGIITHKLIRNPGIKRKRTVATAVMFPFICIVFAGAWFVAYAIINDTVFQRDPGLGDSWYTPLPNGYALMMIDTTDQGTVYNPKTQPLGGGVVGGDDAVFGVRELQVSGDLIFGARDSGYFGRIGQESTTVDSYFELNTKTGHHTEYSSLAELQHGAAAQGDQLNLQPFADVFGRYRTTWFDYTSGVILLVFPLVGFCLLVRMIWRTRREGSVVSAV